MQKADYFVKEQTKQGTQFILLPEETRDNAMRSFHAAEAIRLACEQMERAAGQLSAYSLRYQQPGK